MAFQSPQKRLILLESHPILVPGNHPFCLVIPPKKAHRVRPFPMGIPTTSHQRCTFFIIFRYLPIPSPAAHFAAHFAFEEHTYLPILPNSFRWALESPAPFLMGVSGSPIASAELPEDVRRPGGWGMGAWRIVTVH